MVDPWRLGQGSTPPPYLWASAHAGVRESGWVGVAHSHMVGDGAVEWAGSRFGTGRAAASAVVSIGCECQAAGRVVVRAAVTNRLMVDSVGQLRITHRPGPGGPVG